MIGITSTTMKIVAAGDEMTQALRPGCRRARRPCHLSFVS